MRWRSVTLSRKSLAAAAMARTSRAPPRGIAPAPDRRESRRDPGERTRDGRAEREGQRAGQCEGGHTRRDPQRRAVFRLRPGKTGGGAEVGGEPILDGLQAVDALRGQPEPRRGIGERQGRARRGIEDDPAQALDLARGRCALGGVEKDCLGRVGTEAEQGLVGRLPREQAAQAFEPGEIDSAGADDRRRHRPLLAGEFLQGQECRVSRDARGEVHARRDLGHLANEVQPARDHARIQGHVLRRIPREVVDTLAMRRDAVDPGRQGRLTARDGGAEGVRAVAGGIEVEACPGSVRSEALSSELGAELCPLRSEKQAGGATLALGLVHERADPAGETSEVLHLDHARALAQAIRNGEAGHHREGEARRQCNQEDAKAKRRQEASGHETEPGTDVVGWFWSLNRKGPVAWLSFDGFYSRATTFRQRRPARGFRARFRRRRCCRAVPFGKGWPIEFYR
jgi:hypothetical protein